MPNCVKDIEVKLTLINNHVIATATLMLCQIVDISLVNEIMYSLTL